MSVSLQSAPGDAFVTDMVKLRQLSVGPEAALSLLVGQVVTQITMSDPHSIPEHPEKIAIAIALMITLQV
jgi:MFS superfamily sulfate permease-like transporter